jgi:hypothetical protein
MIFNNSVRTSKKTPHFTITKVSYDSQCKQGLFPKTGSTSYLCNAEKSCVLCGTDWILKYYLHELRLQRVKSHEAAMLLFYSLQKVSCQKLDIFRGFTIRNIQDPSVSGSTVASTSGVRTAVVLVLLIVQSTEVGFRIVTLCSFKD